jgi:4-amino-4-deoxy-L-arabinose transferase-like glycosyltransferase
MSRDLTTPPASPGRSPRAAPGRRPGDVERAIGRFAVRRYGWCVLLVLSVMAANVFLRLSSTFISDSDEARYGVSAYEMLQSHSYLVTTYARQPEYWNLKPPLGYWLIALSFRLFGYTSFALRLPSAIFGLLVVAGTMAFAKRWGNRRLAVLSGLVIATAFGFLSNHGARSGDLDAALTFLLLLAAMQLPRLWRGRRPGRALLALAAILGGAFLLKSFAILPMIVVTAGWTAWSGAWRRLRRRDWAAAGLLFTAIVAAWAAARWRADGTPYFLLRMLREDLFLRSTRIIDHTTYSPFGYVTALFDRFAPWPAVMAVAAWIASTWPGWRPSALARRLRRGVLPLLLLWVAVPLLLFSLSRTQHHWYLDPAYPACAMLAAFAVLTLLRLPRPGRPRAAALAGLVVLPLVLCQARITYRVMVRERMTPHQRLLARLRHQRGRFGGELVAGFPLQHSERFLLEVIDGFDVRDVADGPPTPGIRLAEGDLVVGPAGRTSGRGWRSRGAELIAADGRCAVYRNAGRFGAEPAVRPLAASARFGAIGAHAPLGCAGARAPCAAAPGAPPRILWDDGL